MDPAVFLDRDNTLIVNDGDLGSPNDVHLIDGVANGLKALRAAGFRLIVVTNQGGVARGAFSEEDVDAVHQRIASLIDRTADTHDLINRFYYCPYHPQATLDAYRRDHPWRKPNPGMLLQAARDLNVDLSTSWMIGDQPRDVAAGRSAGCRTVLLGEEGNEADIKPTLAVRTFPEAVQAILRSAPPRTRRRAEGTPPDPAPPPAGPQAGQALQSVTKLERSLDELINLLRADRSKRVEFSGLRLAAGMLQLLVLLLAVLAVLQLGVTELFAKWMAGAVLLQLLTIALLLVDLKE